VKRALPVVLALSTILATAGTVTAADFPEQANPHSCGVVLNLPKDVIGHLFGVSPATAERLLAQLADACNL
jgi:hypothetical protein